MGLHFDPEPASQQPIGGLHAGRGRSFDLAAVRSHAEIIYRLAAPLAGKGKLIVAGFGEDPDRTNPKTAKLGCPVPPIVRHVAVGDMHGMVRAIAGIADRPHYNAYSPLAVFRPDLPNGKKGSEGDILAVLGLVADFDDADAPRWAERLPVPPNYVLETSAGRFQAFHFFETPQQPGDAKPSAERLRAFAGCDHGTADLSHVWRIAGCLNWPNSRKIAGGRSQEPQAVKVISPWGGSAVSLADFAAALTSAKLDGRGAANGSPTEPKAGTNGTGSADFDSARAHADGAAGARDAADAALTEAIVKALPKRLHDRIVQPASVDRSRNLYFAIKSLIARELDDRAIKRIIQRYPTASAQNTSRARISTGRSPASEPSTHDAERQKRMPRQRGAPRDPSSRSGAARCLLSSTRLRRR